MNTTAQVKQALKKSGQQVAAEPLELLKAARDQITAEQGSIGNGEQYQDPQEAAARQKQEENARLQKQVDASDTRHIEALQNEIRDITRQKIFNDLLQKIQNGEAVAIEEFQELTHEQRDVLKAQREAAITRQNQQAQQQNSAPVGSSKPSRRMGGQKKAAQKQETRVEKPVPPSG
jgi:hypothetical protein